MRERTTPSLNYLLLGLAAISLVSLIGGLLVPLREMTQHMRAREDLAQIGRAIEAHRRTQGAPADLDDLAPFLDLRLVREIESGNYRVAWGLPSEAKTAVAYEGGAWLGGGTIVSLTEEGRPVVTTTSYDEFAAIVHDANRWPPPAPVIPVPTLGDW